MDDLAFNMSNKWKCPNCKVSNENRASKCAFCNTPQPSKSKNEDARKEEIVKEHEEMMKLMYRLIHPLHMNQKKKLLRYIEDNF